MSQNIKNKISRRDIEQIALSSIKPDDIQHSLEILQSVFKSGKNYESASSLMPLLKDPSVSVALKLISLFIYRLWRVWSSASLIESVNALKDLSWLQACLKAKSKKNVQTDTLIASTDLQFENKENMPATGHDPIFEGIMIVYHLCVNRIPVQEEIDIWKKNLSGGLEFAKFLKLMYLSPEGEKHRNSSLGMVADFYSRTDLDIVDRGVIGVYQLCLGRTPQQVEINNWKINFSNGYSFAEFLCSTYNCQEAKNFRKSDLTFMSNGEFIQLVYEAILGRGCHARDIAGWERSLTAGIIDRNAVLKSLFGEYAKVFALESEYRPVHDGLSCQIMGANQYISIEDWRTRAQELKSNSQAVSKAPVFHSRFHIKREPMPLVTAIASLYKGGKFIEQFMDNIVSQTCFDDYCELIIIDADSPENESEVIERYCKQHKNIVYHRMNHCIGIYDAWNVGAKLARGEYLTNTNLDDLRRQDSLELQAGVLDNLPFVDVVYQDFHYTFDPRLSVEEIARFGYRSTLPVVTAHNMMDFNSPHNAPMWRKKLHEELGYFDVFYKSAGDYEFWMRCLAAKKVFYKINDPHVVYYQNPEGLSTRPDTRGVEEAQRILKTYGRRLVSENGVMPINQFEQNLSQKSGVQVQVAESRYTCAQYALRDAAIKKKYMRNAGEMKV